MLSKYEIFSTIVEVGSLTKAAEILNLTQSGVSYAVATLEAELGLSLLKRDRSGIALTSNGERILRHIKDILQQEEYLKQEVAALKGLETGTVKFGTFSSISRVWLPGILKKFESDHPAIEIQFLKGSNDYIRNLISTGEVDFGFVSLPAGNSGEIIPLKKDRLFVILPPDHHLQHQNRILFDQLTDEPFIMPKWGTNDDIMRILHKKHIKPQVKYEVADDRTIIAMVQQGLGISILPEMLLFHLPDNMHVISLEEAHFRTIGIATPSFKTISPAAKKFINCTRWWLQQQNLLDFAKLE